MPPEQDEQTYREIERIQPSKARDAEAPERRPESLAKRLCIIHPHHEAAEHKKQRHAHRRQRVENSAGQRIGRKMRRIKSVSDENHHRGDEAQPVSAGTRTIFMKTPGAGRSYTFDVPANKPISASNDHEPYDFWSDELKELYDRKGSATFLERWHSA